MTSSTHQVVCAPRQRVTRLLLALEGGLFLLIFWVIRLLWQHPGWAYAFFLGVLLLLFVGLLVKLVLGQRSIMADAKGLQVRYHWLGRTQYFPLKSLKSWREDKVRTSKQSTYAQLSIFLHSGTVVKVSSEEFSNYEQMRNYLKSLQGKKRK